MNSQDKSFLIFVGIVAVTILLGIFLTKLEGLEISSEGVKIQFKQSTEKR